MKVLVIIPAYNEEGNIEKLLTDISDYEVDVLVINDCSLDMTSRICRRFARGRSNINVVDLPTNLGIGGAVQTGYRYAFEKDYDIAIQIDGDGQHNPSYINKVIEPIKLGISDFVIGSRYIEKQGFQSTLSRRIGISYFRRLISVLYGKK